jgi:malate dehydrogenase (quinone)
MSFVWGAENVEYLKKRQAALTKYPLFAAMQYSEDFDQLARWMPLVMDGRDRAQPVAATWMEDGTDVNFGALTRQMLDRLKAGEGVALHFNHEVAELRQEGDKRWRVAVRERDTGRVRQVRAKFVFIGAGGGSLPLLLKSGIPEGRGFGGFPVSGQWLKCTNPEVIERHDAKVYGKAAVGSPPMSVPHLDTRVIDGQKALLFGPYAGFSTRFLKKGSLFDLPFSIKPGNMIPMLSVGRDNIPLTKYLIDQVRQSPEDRLRALRDFFPGAKAEDWELEMAGQRVQIIKKDEKRGGILEFGTEVVSSADGTIAALLGASPGASTTVSIMLTLMQKCFAEEMKSERWQSGLKQLIGSFGQPLAGNAELCEQVRTHTAQVLELKSPQPAHDAGKPAATSA